MRCFYEVPYGYHVHAAVCAPHTVGAYTYYKHVLGHVMPACDWDEEALKLATRLMRKRHKYTEAALQRLDGGLFLLTFRE